jgi:hypothetical protein
MSSLWSSSSSETPGRAQRLSPPTLATSPIPLFDFGAAHCPATADFDF